MLHFVYLLAHGQPTLRAHASTLAHCLSAPFHLADNSPPLQAAPLRFIQGSAAAAQPLDSFYQRLAAARPSDLPLSCGQVTLRMEVPGESVGEEQVATVSEEQWLVCNALGAGEWVGTAYGVHHGEAGNCMQPSRLVHEHTGCLACTLDHSSIATQQHNYPKLVTP